MRHGRSMADGWPPMAGSRVLMLVFPACLAVCLSQGSDNRTPKRHLQPRNDFFFWGCCNFGVVGLQTAIVVGIVGT